MKKLVNKLRVSFKNWLLKDEIDKLVQSKNQYDTLIRLHSNLKKEQELTVKQLQNIYENIGVGVDVHQYSPSWAVVCIQGKTDFIKFINLGTSDLREIHKFLRHFDRRNISMDIPTGLSKIEFFKIFE